MDHAESNFEAALPYEHFKDVLKLDVRPDGRELGEFRKTSVNLGSIGTADGSALVQRGNTMVICGIKAELTKPPASEPDKGIIVPNVDLPPLCAAHFRPGPPSEQAQITSQLLHDLIKASNVIDLQKLCICKDKLVWVLYCDVMCLSYDGNINDAAILALICALGNTRIPKIEYDEEHGTIKKISDPEQRSNLTLEKRLVSSTFVQFESTHIIADPTLKEESVTGGTVTIVTDEFGKVCHLHRPGGSPLSDKTFKNCVKRAAANGKKLHALVDLVLNDEVSSSLA